MIKRYQRFMGVALRVSDALVVVLAWVAAYWARFYLPPFEITKGLPPFTWYASAVPFVAVLWAGVFTLMGIYEQGRMRRRTAEVFLLWKAHLVASLVLVAMAHAYDLYSRIAVAYFIVLAALFLACFRVSLRSALQYARQRGHNLRHVLIVGEGRGPLAVAERLARYPELGVRVRGLVTKTGEPLSPHDLTEVLGNYSDLPRLVAAGGIDEVLFAMPSDQQSELKQLLGDIQDETIDIRILPDVQDYVTLGCDVEDFDGLPIVRLNDSPMAGGRAMLKRTMDVALSAVGLVLIAPVLLIIAIAVKVTSAGPIFYSQERTGLDRRSFRMWKFRTMRVDAEATGSGWTRPNDDRRTPIGAFLRATSLDELPQLANVLMGEMSLVGPRPERPVYVNQFRREIAHYNLRHKVKAGITGWAQVNGWRGDTSLERRIECDLYYIQNWSLALDLKILTMTLYKGFINKNAY